MNKSQAPSSGVARPPRVWRGRNAGEGPRELRFQGVPGRGGVRLCENVEEQPDRKRVWLRPDLVMNACRLASKEVFP